MVLKRLHSVFVAILLIANFNYAQGIKGLDISNELKAESFNYQQKCIHHDNFHREVIRKEKWKIGENYGSKITYYSPRKDNATVDDGFRIKTIIEETGDKNYPHKIISGYLTNDQNVSVEKAFRFITTSSYLKDNFFIEVSIPTAGNYSEIVCNYYDDKHYDSFEITRTDKGRVVVYLKRLIKGHEIVTELANAFINATSVKIAQAKGKISLCLDEKPYTGGTIPFVINIKRPIGVMVSKYHTYEYRVFDVYMFDELRHIKAGTVANNGIPNGWNASFTKDYSYTFLPTLIVANIGEKLPRISVRNPEHSFYLNTSDGQIYENNDGIWIKTGKTIDNYAMYYNIWEKRIYVYNGGQLVKQGECEQSDFPAYVQRFELRAVDVTDTKSAHCEIAENTDFSINNYNLRKRRVSFKTFLPVTFFEDDGKAGGEALIQFQISTDGGKSRVPLFTIASEVVSNNQARFHLNRRYIPTRPINKSAKWTEKILGEDDVDLGKANLGVWDHWEVYVKEGYMKEHCPLLTVKRNGKVVYKSDMPNTYNIMSGSYIRYGVYKSIYRYDDSPQRKRVVYISDFECDI